MTRRLILMRHAKSDWSSGQIDHERPLNARGRASSEVLGNWLRKANLIPDHILCSSARRTCETLAGLSLDAPADLLKRLYHASAAAMFDALTDAKGDTVLMIGHNPGIGDLALTLVERPPHHERFSDYPTGATLVVEFDANKWPDVMPGQGRVLDFVVPRELT